MEEQAYQCGYCGAQFGSKEQLEQHSRQQRGHEATHDRPGEASPRTRSKAGPEGR